MDLHCPRCYEPWDNDEFHYIAEEYETTYKYVVDLFHRYGCVVMENVEVGLNLDYNSLTPTCEKDPRISGVADAILEIMGDDTDGIASAWGDAEYFGYI